MRSSRMGPIPSEIGGLVDELDDVQRRLRILEAPSGEALSSTVAKLSALVADIQAQLDAWAAGRWTNAQITAQITSQINSTFAGSPTVGGNLLVNGTLHVPNAYNFDITYTRRTAWWGNDGRAGYASSSATKKCAIRPADIDPNAVLTLEPRSFYYRREIERRTQMRIDGLGDYVPKREVGLLAQELDALGLGWLVYYDEGGNAEGIEYSMLTVALLAVARSEHAARLAIEARLTALEEAHG